MRVGAFLVMAVVVSGCGGGGGSQACQPLGQACDVTHLCCGDDLCTDGQCVAPASCGHAGNSCSTASPCCSGFACNTNGACAVSTTCGTTGAACSPAANDCCQGSTCPRFGPTCQLGNIGDPCQATGDCLVGLTCEGWCTRACTSTAECHVGNDADNECINTTQGYLCVPFCNAEFPCSVYGDGVVCTTGSTIEGLNGITICSS
jgi:hypothetical protein